jgi:small GTP-binding protein
MFFNSLSIPMIKVVVLGDTNVGKTCLITRFVNDSFSDAGINTIRDAHYRVEMDARSAPAILDIWDTPGQEEYASCSTALLRGAHCCVVCYDGSTKPRSPTAPSPHDQVNVFVNRYQDICPAHGFVVVSANKCDLMADDRQAAETDQLQAQHNKFRVRSFLTSAKTGEGVKELFEFVAQHSRERAAMLDPSEGGIRLRNSDQPGCC